MSKMEVHYLTHNDHKKMIQSKSHVMGIGFFDGIHLGHQKLLRQAKIIAKKEKVLFTVLTFTPHPEVVIKGNKNWKYITPLSDKIVKMKEMGVDKLFVMKFDKTFASLSPEHFVKNYVIKANVRHVVVGFDFTFGHRAKGDVKYLQQASGNNVFDLTVIEKKVSLNKEISSTLLRHLIRRGQVEMIPYYMGEHYRINARCKRITHRNQWTIQFNECYVLPETGVYQIKILHDELAYYGELILNSSLNEAEIISDGLHGHLTADGFAIEFLYKVAESSAAF